MDFSDYNVQLVTPITPVYKTKDNKKDKKDKKQYYIYPSMQQRNSKDSYTPNSFEMSPNTLYNNKGVIYAKDDSAFKKQLIATLNKIIPLEENESRLRAKQVPEYARTYLQVQDLHKENPLARGALPVVPLYGSSDSYSAYVNRNPDNYLYQQVKGDKKRKDISSIDEIQEYYF